MVQKIKWWTISEYVDTETGEIIAKNDIKQKTYRITNKSQKNELIKDRYGNVSYGTRKFTFECKRHEQTKLFE